MYSDISESANIFFRIQRFPRPQLFLGGFGFRPHPHVSSKSSIQIHNFLNPLARVEIFEYAMIRVPDSLDTCGRKPNPQRKIWGFKNIRIRVNGA